MFARGARAWKVAWIKSSHHRDRIEDREGWYKMRGRRPVKRGKSALQIFSRCVVHATSGERAFQTPLNEFSGISILFSRFYETPRLFTPPRRVFFFDVALIISSVHRDEAAVESSARLFCGRYNGERLPATSIRINGLVSQSIRRISLLSAMTSRVIG